MDAALKLREALTQRGNYNVVMTRAADGMSNTPSGCAISRANADLFISLHADANANTEAHGASVYTLDERGPAAQNMMGASIDLGARRCLRRRAGCWLIFSSAKRPIARRNSLKS